MNKNLMNMDGMKRAAKMLMKGSDLGAVVIDQKCLQEVVSAKLIPSISNASMALLKWSYTESNYTFPDVFSAWADLDAGFIQLLQEYLEECSRYRKSFKDIIAEGKNVSDVQKEKEKTANKVAATTSKLENARKAAKKNESNEKARTTVSNLEADLHMAKAKDEETEELLRNTVADFELYKATMLKDSMTTHCQALRNLLQKGADLCQVKLAIVESMPDEPATTPDFSAENNRKVEDTFNRLHLQLPPRDPTVERNLPIQRYKTLPPPATHYPPKSPKISKQTSAPVNAKSRGFPKPAGGVQVFKPPAEVDSEDAEDDDDYMVPDEGMVPRDSVKEKPPQLPPRNAAVEEEEEYVIPSLSPTSLSTNQGPVSPGKSSHPDYFEVVSDDEGPAKPTRGPSKPLHSARLPPEKQQETTAPISEPVYTVPPEDEEDFNQLYGNMTNEELQEHQRNSVVLPTKPAPYGKPRKPAVLPKPVQKGQNVTPSPTKQDSSSHEEEVAEDADDIYSLVYEDDKPPNSPSSKTGGSPPTQHKPLSDSQHLGQGSQADSSRNKPQHAYVHFSEASESGQSSTEEDYESHSKSEESGITHTYGTCMSIKRVVKTDERIYANVPGSPMTDSETKKKPSVHGKPVALPRKPAVPARGGVK